jgi:hypothetical protein
MRGFEAPLETASIKATDSCSNPQALVNKPDVICHLMTSGDVPLEIAFGRGLYEIGI